MRTLVFIVCRQFLCFYTQMSLISVQIICVFQVTCCLRCFGDINGKASQIRNFFLRAQLLKRFARGLANTRKSGNIFAVKCRKGFGPRNQGRQRHCLSSQTAKGSLPLHCFWLCCQKWNSKKVKRKLSGWISNTILFGSSLMFASFLFLRQESLCSLARIHPMAELVGLFPAVHFFAARSDNSDMTAMGLQFFSGEKRIVLTVDCRIFHGSTRYISGAEVDSDSHNSEWAVGFILQSCPSSLFLSIPA